MPRSAERAILQLLALVPAGQVVSYGQLADLAGLPGRSRLAGRVLRNADTRDLPWHRVVAADGRISLPAGSSAAQEQRARLLAEGVTFTGARVNMQKHRWQPDLAAMLMLLKG
ncbi:MGMT family protein [Oceanimonas pelagia]|uniref:MGMT family protein n=1 Tax=Oceanimonas pelagia TaxID=3028314 RepID=A0AA50KPG6_9GAMM|nr:MGMT family protein [Oceanimonas pelagia]WMC11986.1 MGMT family protein [Oceanimonas pelagia]